MGEPDAECLDKPEVLDRAPRRDPVHDPEEDREDGEEDRDLPGIAELLLDEALPRGAGERGRDRRDRDVPGDPLVRSLDPPPPDALDEGLDQPADVTPEVDDDGKQRAEMKRDVERLVEVRMVLEVVPAKGPGDEDQVTRRGDRKQLGGALGDSEHERLPAREPPGGLPYSQRREHEREHEGGGGDRDDCLPPTHCARVWRMR